MRFEAHRNSTIEKELRAQLDRAIEAYWAAKTAHREESQARQVFDAAFARYSDFITTGKVPSDLEINVKTRTAGASSA